MKTRHDEMREQVTAFHKENPKVYQLFEKFSFQLIARGFNNYSSNAVFERIRWETDEADTDGKSTFKINNNYRAFFARAFMKRHPEYDGFYRLRKQTSQDGDATHLPELGPTDFG